MTTRGVLSRCARIRVIPSKATNFLPPNKKGGGAPIGAIQPRSAPSRVRRRADRRAPAFRRSTAALATAPKRCNSSPGPRFLELPGANGRTLPGASSASSSQTGRNAGRSVPEAARERFAKPRAGTAFAPLSGSHLKAPFTERVFASIKNRDACQWKRDNNSPVRTGLFQVIPMLLARPRQCNRDRRVKPGDDEDFVCQHPTDLRCPRSVRYGPILFSNSGSGCQALHDHPCRAHCSLRGRGKPSA